MTIHRNKATPIVDGMKLCRVCLQTKPVGAFPRASKNRTGVYGYCKACTNAKNKSARERHKGTYCYARSWAKRNPEARRAYLAEKYRALKRQVMMAYGKRCAKCGFSDERALHIDHVNEDGASDRRRRTPLQRLQAILSEGCPSDYQVLCANCNTIKAVEMGSLRFTPIVDGKAVVNG